MKCFHHCDIDGRSAGAVVAKFENDYNPSDFFEVDYTQPLPLSIIQPDEKVYFVDYSFSENTQANLSKILSITKNLIWIDHHQSSLDMLKSHPEFKTIPGLVKSGISGAALTYMYLYHTTYQDLPLFLKYISDYDCFILEYPDTLQFKYGVESMNHGPLSDLWRNALNNQDILEDLINRGEIIKSYYDNQARDILDSYGYETTIDGYSALILNRDGNSTLFGDKFNQYDICVRFTFNGEKYIYSLFTHRDDIDLSKIAGRYGGGGHKQAAGMTTDNLLFKSGGNSIGSH